VAVEEAVPVVGDTLSSVNSNKNRTIVLSVAPQSTVCVDMKLIYFYLNTGFQQCTFLNYIAMAGAKIFSLVDHQFWLASCNK
jgi:hypothetical protein